MFIVKNETTLEKIYRKVCFFTGIEQDQRVERKGRAGRRLESEEGVALFQVLIYFDLFYIPFVIFDTKGCNSLNALKTVKPSEIDLKSKSLYNLLKVQE
jgi:hypothetical protein